MSLNSFNHCPKDFVVDGLSNEMYLGTNYMNLTISNTDGELVENARVTLLMGNDVIFESNYTDSNGNVSFDWNDIDEAGTMYVTVTKQNYRPLEDVVTFLDDYAIDIVWDGDLESSYFFL